MVFKLHETEIAHGFFVHLNHAVSLAVWGLSKTVGYLEF